MNRRNFIRWLVASLILLAALGVCGFAVVSLIVIGGMEGTAGRSLGGGGEWPKPVCAVVFGAAVRRNARPGPGISRRVATAARLYKEGMLEHIIMSGGKGEGMDASEAEVMRETAIADGIPESAIILEGEARSTWENLANSRPLTGSCATVLAISDRYHLARIAFLARAQGWEAVSTLPSDLKAPWYFEMRSISREVAAILYYFLLTTLLPINEIPTHTIVFQPESEDIGLLINKTVQLDLSIVLLT